MVTEQAGNTRKATRTTGRVTHDANDGASGVLEVIWREFGRELELDPEAHLGLCDGQLVAFLYRESRTTV